MKISRTQIYWGIGITAGLLTVGVLAHRNRKAVKEIADKAQAWMTPAVAKVTSRFGYRTDPKTGELHAFHNGVDFAVPVGTPIKSPRAGIVASITSAGDGGNQIIIKHDNGYRTGYAHLSKVNVKKGDKVKSGDIIGLSGNTGKSTGPHLHFTLTSPTGAKVDPLEKIRAGVL